MAYQGLYIIIIYVGHDSHQILDQCYYLKHDDVRANYLSLTLNLGTNGLKVTPEPTSMTSRAACKERGSPIQAPPRLG
ncbi:hypothetical protein J6590_037471 [Homalodisca vitripennis]|nr:hypothetical protein J6590_037471 [Homalodisca vitripennis]